MSVVTTRSCDFCGCRVVEKGDPDEVTGFAPIGRHIAVEDLEGNVEEDYDACPKCLDKIKKLIKRGRSS